MESPRTFRFGSFALDTKARQLSKNGFPVKLRGQPYLILELLLVRAGEVVTRDEIREKLWPADTFVDFDRCLNTSVMNLRQALRDSAEKPRYIETVPRVGYRFVAPVDVEKGTFRSLSSRTLTAGVNDSSHVVETIRSDKNGVSEVEVQLQDYGNYSIAFEDGVLSSRIKHVLMRYAFGVLAAVAALLLRKLLDPFLGEHHPYHTMWLAVALSARYWKIGPSIATVVTGGLGIWYWFLPPPGFQIPERTELYGFVIFIAFSTLIIRLSSLHLAKADRT